MSHGKTHMVSNRTDPVIVKDDWLNDLMECLLTLLARRGESFSPGENSEEQRCTTDYLEAINHLDQEDILILMPQHRGLHDFWSMPCVAMEIYSDSHLKREDSDKNLCVSDNKSRMASRKDDEVMLFSPSKSDKEILQPSEDDFMSSSETDPGLVMRTLRIMNAKVEEQQDTLQTKKAASYREILVEITALKRKRCDSCSTPSSANSSSAAKQARKSSTATKKKLPPTNSKTSEKSITPAVNILTASAVSDAAKEVQDLEADNSMEGVFQAALPARGWEAKDIPF
jgi:hypothetical protein